MTYLEKVIQDHPELGRESIANIMNGECPHGRYPNVEIPDFCGDSSVNCFLRCQLCWNREIPETLSKTNKKEEAPEFKLDTVIKPAIKDSGDRTQFETGAVRDMREGKGRCDLMPLHVLGDVFKDGIFTHLAHFLEDPTKSQHLYDCLNMAWHMWDSKPTMFLEVAKHFEDGAKKYGESNWQKGIPTHCYIDSAVRHYLKWRRGDKDEPHDRAFVWNLMCCIWEVDYGEEARKRTKET